MYFLTVLPFWNVTSTKSHLFGEFWRTGKYLHITTSRVGDHRLSAYLLVAFNTDKATCHQGDGANIVAFSIAICQSWFLRVCWSTFIEWVGQNWTNTLLGKFMVWGSILVWSAISPKYVARLASIWACRLTAPCLPESRKAEVGWYENASGTAHSGVSVALSLHFPMCSCVFVRMTELSLYSCYCSRSTHKSECIIHACFNF